jgi:DNA helicase II / ATP-dependent DNA helicase PcrA
MKFTDARKIAIGWPPGNLQLIACADSGKTEVVAQRVAAENRCRRGTGSS